MQQIADWLEKLGMSEYVERFIENRIDFSVLPDLTDQDLEKLGVLLGDRRKMLRAIRELGDASVAGTVSSAPGAAEPTRRDEAERRQLTIMFCDLVGSTALSARLDPEDLRAIISTYHRCCTELVERHGGFVAKYMGDGVLAYFGYPRADEHDAERAVQAGLALAEVVPELRTIANTSLQVRIGIATGLVVVGDLIGAGAAQEQAVVGETPNLAARLQAAAEPGAVVIAASTHLVIGGLFDYRDLGPVSLKGFGENVSAWRVIGASAVESRFEAQRRASLTPLVGREDEVDLLLRRWSQAQTGDGQVVILIGEPGIGKSRTTQAIQDQLPSEGHTRLRYSCSPHHRDSALYPLIAQLERAAGFGRDDAAETKLAKLATVLGQATDRPEEIGLIAQLLSVPTAVCYPVPQMSPQKRKEKILEALLAQVVGLAAHRPVLMLFEDVHWIDLSSLELLSLMVERVCTQRVLLVITARPEFTVPWPSDSHITILPLARLTQHEGTMLIQRVAGNRALPDEVMNQLLSRTDGVPLFIEELTRTVLESGLLHEESGAFVLTGPLPPFAIPTTLHASLLARLDRLGPVRAVAQVGAALGRQFSYELIAATAQMPEPQLRGSLDQLAASTLIYRRGTPPDAEYTFKHALVQDAAYSTLLRSQRQQLHDRIATTLEGKFPAVAGGQPEIVARHYTEAGLSNPAIEWWRKAGELALSRSAFASGVAHFKAAIELADGLADSPAHRLQQLRLQTIYAQALVHAKGQTARETNAAFARSRELAAGVEDAAERFPAYYGLWTGSYNRADVSSMRELAETFQHEVQHWPNSPEAGIAHRTSGITSWFQGDYATARGHLERALAAYDHERDHHLVARYAWDPGVPAMFYLAMTLWPVGEVDRAVHLMEQAVSVALEGGHIPTVVYTRVCNCIFASVRRKPDKAAPHAEALVTLARDRGLPQFLAYGKFLLGWALWSGGQPNGESDMREGRAMLQEMEIRPFEPFFGMLLAELEASTGQVEAGLATLDSELQLIERTEQHWSDAEVHRIRGELLFKRQPTDIDAAEQAFNKSIEIARMQQVRTFELRSALSLAKLYQTTGRELAVDGLLVPALIDFIEGPELPEVGQAKYLLASTSKLA